MHDVHVVADPLQVAHGEVQVPQEAIEPAAVYWYTPAVLHREQVFPEAKNLPDMQELQVVAVPEHVAQGEVQRPHEATPAVE